MADYGINIGVNVQSQGVTRLSNQLKELIAQEKKLKDLSKQAGGETDKLNKQLEKNAKKQRDNKAAALASAQAFARNTAQIKKSSAALAEQSKQLDAYRRQVKFGSGAWADFTRAITKTDFTQSIIQLRRFNKEAETTAAALRDMAAGGGRSGAQFAKSQSLKDLLAFEPANTTNAMQAYAQVLEQTINKVDRGSDSYKELALRIRQVTQELNRAIVPTTQYQAPIGPEPPPGSAFGRSPIRGARNIAGSPAARALQNRRVRDALGGGLIGGGFPLLFGQSGTAAALGGIGGLAGGAIGGQLGFALSIVGTAVGEAIDKNIQFKKSLGDLNTAFNKAGSDSKFLASDIDDLAKSLRLTQEEALELAKAFAFLGDKKLGENAAKLFGTPQLLRAVAQIEDAASLGDALRELSAEIGEQEAITLGTEIRGLTVREQRLKIEEKLNQVRGKTVKLTNEEIRALNGGRRIFRGTGTAKRPERFETAIPAAELGVSESSAAFEQFLRSFEDQKTGGKADPTIGLMKRLETVRGQIAAEQELLQLQGKQSQVARMILRHEMAITKAKAAGAAERKKLTDAGDREISQGIELGKITAANLQFEREARELAEQALKATKDLARPLQDQIDQIKDKAAFEREYAELIRSGVVPAVAQQTVEINKQVKELERLEAKQLREMEIHIANLQILLDKATTDELRVDLQEKLNRALERQNEIERKGAEAREEAREAQKTDKDRLQDAIDLIQGEINNLMDPVQQVIGLASTMGNAFAESFKGIVSGSMTAREALANLFQRTADHFLDMAARMIAAQIQMQILKIGLSFFGGGGGGEALPGSAPQMRPDAVVTPAGFEGQFAGFAANGGRIQGGKSYIVGERGPELFTPGASGFVTPNHALGGGVGNIVVNVDASGSSVEGNANEQKQLGEAIGIAIRQELIKQKRPGGLLA